jgi:hypothetical protein
VLSCDVIIWDDNTPFFVFPGNFTHSKMYDPGNFFRKLNENIFSVCYSGGFATPAHHLAAIVGSDLCREPSCFFSAIYIYLSLSAVAIIHLLPHRKFLAPDPFGLLS